MRTIEQAKSWIDQQRAQLGNPRIASVQAYLGDSMETVAVYAEVENQVEINGDLPLVAGFDLPAPPRTELLGNKPPLRKLTVTSRALFAG
jgi:hypothetical protein